MPKHRLFSVFHHLLRRVSLPPATEVSDAELLRRFATTRDEAAFELLLWRHGPMVLSLCRRLLGNEQDAEDAFQATFFVLVRKAQSISKKDSLASWLYKVAYRIACRAGARLVPTTNHGEALAQVFVAENQDEVVHRDMAAMLDREVAQLPESYRRPVVLCYLEGKTNEEAARLLGCPQGTLSARLARARERLRTRLERRGWALSATAFTTLLGDKAFAATVSIQLVRTTLHAALQFATAGAVAGVSVKAVALTEGVLKAMFMQKVKIAAGVILAVVLTGTGVGLAVRQAFAAGGTKVGPVTQAVQPPQDQKKNADAEIAALRAEIATLRAELDAAVKAIKQLKDALGLRTPPREPEPMYRGKPLSQWVEHLRDGDPNFRKDAVIAVGAIAQQKQELISLVVDSLKDFDPGVRNVAVSALGIIAKRKEDLIPVLAEMLKDSEGDNSQPNRGDGSVGLQTAHLLAQLGSKGQGALIEVANSKTSPHARRNALMALRDMRLPATTVLPTFLLALAEDNVALRGIATVGVAHIGPEAKAALPLLVKALEPEVAALKARAAEFSKPGIGKKSSGSLMKFYQDAGRHVLLWGIVKVEPSLRETLVEVNPKMHAILPDDERGTNLRQMQNNPAEIVGLLEEALEFLKKKYPPQN